MPCLPGSDAARPNLESSLRCLPTYSVIIIFDINIHDDTLVDTRKGLFLRSCSWETGDVWPPLS